MELPVKSNFPLSLLFYLIFDSASQIALRRTKRMLKSEILLLVLCLKKKKEKKLFVCFTFSSVKYHIF